MLIQEEMKADTHGSWAEVCDWLDIDAEYRPDLGQVNRSKAVRSEGIRRAVGATPQGVKKLLPRSARRTVSRWLRKINSSHTQRAPLEAALRSSLDTETR